MRNLTKILLFLAICAISTGCDEIGWNPLDPDELSGRSANHVDAPPILLEIAVPTLADSASFYDARTERETGLQIRRRSWRGPPSNDVSASLIEIRHIDAAPLGDPPAPDQIMSYWPQLAQRQLIFQVLYSSRNAIGPVLWRRFVMGPQICVMFTQGWSPDGGPPTRHLLGHYCAPSGVELSDGQAETVVRSVRIREGDPDLSPDGSAT